jgi:hypothetical protein
MYYKSGTAFTFHGVTPQQYQEFKTVASPGRYLRGLGAGKRGGWSRIVGR